MTPSRNQRAVEDQIRNALSMDRARVQIGRISRFGLLEMSRQRLRSSLGESSHTSCPRCLGQGTIRGNESLALSIIRLIEEEALKENTAQVRAILPVETATFLLNEKRKTIMDIEKRQQVQVVIAPNPYFMTPHYEVERIRASDVSEKDEKITSYKLAVKPEFDLPTSTSQVAHKEHQEPAIKSIMLDQSASPIPSSTAKKSRNGLLKRLVTFLFDKKAPPAKETSRGPSERKRHPYQANRDNRGERGRYQNRPHQRNDRNHHSKGNTNRRPHSEHDTRNRTPRPISDEQKAMHTTGEETRQHQPQHQQQHHNHHPRPPRNHDTQRSHHQTHSEPRPHQHHHEPREPREPREVREPRPVPVVTESYTKTPAYEEPRQQHQATEAPSLMPMIIPTPTSQTDQHHGDEDSIGNRAAPSDTPVGERKPRHHFNQRRRKRYGHNRQRRHPQQAGDHQNRHAVEGEDIYSSKTSESKED